MGKIVRVKPGSMTNRNRLGFDFPGSNPLAARRRVENLSGFLLSGTVFWFACPWLDYCGLVYPFSSRVRFPVGAPNQNTVTVRARIDAANGPAWAAPEKHRHLYTRGHAVRPFRQGPGKDWGQVVRHAPFRVNDGLKGLWMLQSIGSGQIGQLVGYHPWATYGEKETGEK